MIEIDGPLWFVGALLICGAHVLYLRGWRRERRTHLAWWQKYDANAQQRHEERSTWPRLTEPPVDGRRPGIRTPTGSRCCAGGTARERFG